MLSRKHYVVIAKIIKDNTIDDNKQRFNKTRLYKNSLINDLCVVFARDNNLFDSSRFRRACDDV